MLAEFLGSLVALVKQSDRLEFVHDEKLRTSYLRSGETVQVMPWPNPARSLELSTIESLIDLASELAEDPDSDPELNVTTGMCILWFDRKTRRDRAVCNFRETSLAELLWKEQRFQYAPKAMIRFLRLWWNGSPEAQKLISAIRRIDFKRRSDGTHVTEHGRESLGRSVELAVQNAEDIPDRILLPVQLTIDPMLVPVLDCAFLVELHYESEQIELVLQGGELQRLERELQLNVFSRLRKQLPSIPIFCGMDCNRWESGR